MKGRLLNWEDYLMKKLRNRKFAPGYVEACPSKWPLAT
jgi:hypothetical protein